MMTYVQDVISDSPFVYWRFSEGTSYNDTMNHRDIKAGSWGDTKDFNPNTRIFNTQGASFFGSDYARSGIEPPNSAWPSYNDLTVEFWIRPKRNRGRETILSMSYSYLNPTSINGFEIYLIDGRIKCSIPYDQDSTSNTPERLLSSIDKLEPNKWHHIMMSYKFIDDSTGLNNQQHKLYIDGSLIASGISDKPYQLNPLISGFNETPGMFIARSNFNSSSTNQFIGDLDEISIYPTALSEERILIHWEGTGLGNIIMATERATVYESCIWGIEPDYKTDPINRYRLLNTELSFDPAPLIRMYKSPYSKFATSASVGKEHTTGNLQGDQAFNDMLFLLRGLITKGTKTSPPNNGIWTIGVGAATAGTFTLTYGGQTTANIPFNASAGAIVTALAALSSIGLSELALVTGTAPTWTLKLKGPLSTGGAVTIDGSLLTGGVAAVASSVAGTARRYTIGVDPFSADDPQTFSLEKGEEGQANTGAKAAGTFVAGLQFKWTVGEATMSGDMFADAKIDPYTIDPTGVIDLPVVPVDPKCISVWLGDSLAGPGAPEKLKRLLELDLDLTGKWMPLKTLDCDTPGITAGVEASPTSTIRMVVEHDTQGQSILQDMRDGAVKIIVFEAIGSDINTNYPYRMKWMAAAKILTSTSADMEGVWATTYSLQIMYSTLLGTGIRFIIDTTDFTF